MTVSPPTASTDFDYSNAGWPRDFDIRIEVAEQKETLQNQLWLKTAKPKRRLRRTQTN